MYVFGTAQRTKTSSGMAFKSWLSPFSLSCLSSVPDVEQENVHYYVGVSFGSAAGITGKPQVRPPSAQSLMADAWRMHASSPDRMH